MVGVVDVSGLIPFEPVEGKFSRVRAWQDAGFEIKLCTSCKGFGEIADCDIFDKDGSYFDKVCTTCGGTGRLLTRKFDCTINLNTKFRAYGNSKKSEADIPCE